MIESFFMCLTLRIIAASWESGGCECHGISVVARRCVCAPNLPTTTLRSPPDVVPRRRGITVSDESSQPLLHGSQVLSAASIPCVGAATVVCTHSQFEVAATLLDHQLHPQRNEAGGQPRVEVLLLAQCRVDVPTREQFAKTLPR